MTSISTLTTNTHKWRFGGQCNGLGELKNTREFNDSQANESFTLMEEEDEWIILFQGELDQRRSETLNGVFPCLVTPPCMCTNMQMQRCTQTDTNSRHANIHTQPHAHREMVRTCMCEDTGKERELSLIHI